MRVKRRMEKTPTVKITPTSMPFAICLKSTKYSKLRSRKQTQSKRKRKCFNKKKIIRYKNLVEQNRNCYKSKTRKLVVFLFVLQLCSFYMRMPVF